MGLIATGLLYPQGMFASYFSAKQREIAQFAYDRGKPHGFQKTMKAIAWQESSLGVNLENEQEGSCGIFGNKVGVVYRRLLQRGMIADKESIREWLIEDRDFAANMCIAELKYWDSKRDNWDDVIRSYNAGWDLRNGNRYLKEIRAKMESA